MPQTRDVKTGVETGYADPRVDNRTESTIFESVDLHSALDVYVEAPPARANSDGDPSAVAYVRVYAMAGDRMVLVSCTNILSGRTGRVIAERGGGRYRVTVQGRQPANVGGATYKKLRIACVAYGLDPGPTQRQPEAICIEPPEWIKVGRTQGVEFLHSRYVRQVWGALDKQPMGVPFPGEVFVQLWDLSDDPGGGTNTLIDAVRLTSAGEGFVFDFRDNSPHASRCDGRFFKNGIRIYLSSEWYPFVPLVPQPFFFFSVESRVVAPLPTAADGNMY